MKQQYCDTITRGTVSLVMLYLNAQCDGWPSTCLDLTPQMTIRQRLIKLVDPGSLKEIGLMAGGPEYQLQTDTTEHTTPAPLLDTDCSMLDTICHILSADY